MVTVVVAGALANKPGNGGEAWVRMSWATGLRRMGFDVCFVEQIDEAVCVDASGTPASVGRSVNLTWFRDVTARFGLTGAAALLTADGTPVCGLTEAALLGRVEQAALLVNISGHLTVERLLQRVGRKAYIDIDPGFTQYWHADGTAPLLPHDAYFTIGENIGRSGCPIPSGGISWHPIRQPVVLAAWPAHPVDVLDRFTTVATWRGPYGPVIHDGRTYGLKLHQFRRFIELPRLADAAFEIALAIHPADAADRSRLEDHGWRLVDPRAVAGDPDAFRTYVQASGAEFSVAQGIYVDTDSGWFSDRTARYLASGRPALVQATGFSRNLPVGEGLVAFRTVAEAVAGADAIVADYERHSRAARELAETYFAHDVVLGRMLDDVGVAP